MLGEVVDKPPGWKTWKLLYADDTVLTSENPRQLERILHCVELVAGEYGVVLNKDKCEVICFGQVNPRINFVDGVPVKKS